MGGVMRIPLFLAVAQWALLLALGLLVIVMYRQLGQMLHRAEPARAGPAPGTRAAAVAYARPGDATARYFTPGDGQAALLAFVDPTCPACEQLVAALGSAQGAGDLDGLRVLLLSSDPPGYLQISPAFRNTALEIGRPAAGSDLASYNASATPLLVAMDGAGIVRSAGPAMSVADVRAFRQACLLPSPPATLGIVPADGSAQPDHPEHSEHPEPAEPVPAAD
jgi:hypothetical protein